MLTSTVNMGKIKLCIFLYFILYDSYLSVVTSSIDDIETTTSSLLTIQTSVTTISYHNGM
jgi:hypothetical protein